MPDGSALLKEIPSSSRLSTCFSGDKALLDREVIAKNLHDRRELNKFRKLVEEERNEQAEMAELVGQPIPEDLDADWLTSRAARLREKSEEFVETLRPVIDMLKRLLSPAQTLEPEIERLLRDSVQVLEAYPGIYNDLSGWLTEQAAQRRMTSPEVLRARPVRGKIDYTELSREHIARYPKIRARLAE